MNCPFGVFQPSDHCPGGKLTFPSPSVIIYALVLLFCKHTVLVLHLGWQAGEGGMKRFFPQTSSTLKFPAQRLGCIPTLKPALHP